MRIFHAMSAALLFTVHLSFGQTESDSTVYNEGLRIMDRSKTFEEFLKAASYFENLSAEKPEQWMAEYYAGLSFILASRKSAEKPISESLLNKAQEHIDKSFILNPDEAENHILQAFLYQTRIQSGIEGNGFTLSQKAEASLKKALNADSANPRAYFLMASNIYYTPAVFKGGSKNALPVFQKAQANFKTYIGSYSFSPDWGYSENEEMIKLCRKEMDLK